MFYNNAWYESNWSKNLPFLPDSYGFEQLDI